MLIRLTVAGKHIPERILVGSIQAAQGLSKLTHLDSRAKALHQETRFTI
jgi:hypothetical protein